MIERARARRPLWTSAWVFLLVLVVLGFGFVASRPAPPPEQRWLSPDVAAARAALHELATPGASKRALAALPEDFTAVTGVAAGLERAPDGTMRAVHLGGGCSTPWGDDGTRWNFSAACKSHDLGYDLLRYAEANGQPLGPGLRQAIDQRLSADMHAMCVLDAKGAATACDMVATLYTAATVVNSWHQRWGPPVGQPIAPMLAGVAAIALLLAFRLRGWIRARKTVTSSESAISERAPPAAPPARAGPWASLAVISIVVIMLGQSALALANWAGVDAGWLWPATWLCQLACVFFFAGGKANASGWRAVTASGGGYRQYLSCRAGWLLRTAMVFAVVAFATPLALELLGIGRATTAAVVRIALHPLWLLGVYVITVAAAPLLLALGARARGLVPAVLATGVVLCGVASQQLDSALPAYGSTLALALLAQQLAFLPSTALRKRRTLIALTATAAAGLVSLAALGAIPLTLLGSPQAAPVLTAPALPVALLGALQLGVLGMASPLLTRLGERAPVASMTTFAVRAPMSLYLAFLTAMLLVVTVVAMPSAIGNWLGWLVQPSSLLALCLPAVPAVFVFLWFERHLGPFAALETFQPDVQGRLGNLLARAATVLGIGYATIGLFGLALVGFGGSVGEETLLGLSLEPIQSLVRMLLGICMLHTVRTGASSSPSTWVLTALACVPPVLASTAGPTVNIVAFAPHTLTALFALAAGIATTYAKTRTPRIARAEV